MAEHKRNEELLLIALGMVIAYFIYAAVMHELPQTYADYNGHLYVYLPAFTGESWLKGWRTVPYCMWHMCVLALNLLLHIPLEASAAYVSCFFQLLTYFLIYWMIQKYTEAKGNRMSSAKAAVLAAGSSIVQGLHFEWLDLGGRFLGTFSMNPIHNPTQMAVRPFVLLSFALVIDIWGAQEDKTYKGIFFKVENGPKKYYLYLTALLFLSSLAKPVFALMFIPAVGLLMLGRLFGCIRRRDNSAASCFKQCVTMFLCAVPTVLYVMLSAASYYIIGDIYQGEGSLTLTKWMEVWNMYTENVILSIALGMAFPLFLVLIDGRFFLREAIGRLALTGYLVGLLEAAVMGEEGHRLSHADYIWPMMCGMLLMWMAALLRLAVLERIHAETKWKKILIYFAWFLFCAHVLCGILYLKEMM